MRGRLAVGCTLLLAGCMFEGELSERDEAGPDQRLFGDGGADVARPLGDGARDADVQASTDLEQLDTATPAQICPNGVREGSEACDGEDLGGKSCQSEGYDLGELACNSNCTLDTSGCVDCGAGVPCGGSCCASPDVCVSGTCCAADRACGGQCCGAADTCLNNSCCAANRVCGSACCASGQFCYDGATCRAPVTSEIALYVTTASYLGNLGGRSGADVICASDRPLELSCGKLRAFLSTSLSDTIQAMPTNHGFSQTQPLYFYNRAERRMNRLASNWSDALDGSIAISAKAGTGASFSSWNAFWTGSKADGSYSYQQTYDYACAGFTTSSGDVPNVLGTAGDAAGTGYWVRSSQNYVQCYHDYKFLCACDLH